MHHTRTRWLRARAVEWALLLCSCQRGALPEAAPEALEGATRVPRVEALSERPPGLAVPSDWRLAMSAAPARGRHALVVSDSPLATRAGVLVLEGGGNAFDAAVAIAFVLAVVYPEAGNLGGGGFAVMQDADGARAALDFRETAPERATRDMYRVAPKEGIPGNAGRSGGARAKIALGEPSKVGHLSAGVPGSVAGLWALHQRFGSKPWAELLAPAISFAREGFVVDRALSRSIADAESKLLRFEASRALFLPRGVAPSEGQRLDNPDLGEVLSRVAERGPRGFYSGPTAELIADEMQRGGGIVSRADLERYQPKWRAPIELEYRGHTIVSMPPPSSGGVALALLANILRQDELSAQPYHGAEHLHLLAEAMRRAFADRNALLGDPDFVAIPLERLLSPAYGAERRASITEVATPSRDVSPGSAKREGNHTTHVAVVDARGAAVSLTTTINDFYGSGVTVTGAGFLLNDEMDDFTSDPGVPNLFGLVQGEANAIAPGKRMLSSMAPTLVLDASGAVKAVAGARGGPRIITATFQVISNILDFGMDAVHAVRAPRLHEQWQPDEITLEQGGFSAAQLDLLERRGHTLRFVPELASAPVILRERVGGEWTGAFDPRRGGAAAGF